MEMHHLPPWAVIALALVFVLIVDVTVAGILML